MKAVQLACVALLLCAGSAFGTDYYWDCTTTGTGVDITAAANWNPTSGPPGAADSVLFANNAIAKVVTNTTLNYGSMTFAAASQTNSLIYDQGRTYTINIGGDAVGNKTAGTTGDWIWRASKGFNSYNTRRTVNLYGNLLVTGTAVQVFGTNTVANLWGANKGFAEKTTGNSSEYNVGINVYGSYYDNGSTMATNSSYSQTVNVKNGGRIITNPSAAVAGLWVAHQFTFANGTASLPNMGECVTFSYIPYWTNGNFAGSDNGTSRLVVAAGVAYPWDVRVGQTYGGSTGAPGNGEFTWRLQSWDAPTTQTNRTTTVGRDLFVNPSSSNSGSWASNGFMLNLEENGTQSGLYTARPYYLNINRSLHVGDTGTSLTAANRYGVRFKNAVVTVADCVTFGKAYSGGALNYTQIALDNAQIAIGGNFTINRMDAAALAFWKTNNAASTSKLIFDGAGLGKTQNLITFATVDNVMFHDVVINNVGGIVKLDNALFQTRRITSGLWLTGSLDIQAGTFQQGNQYIIFNGDCHTIRNLVDTDTYSFDNILLRPDAALTLLSDIHIQYGASASQQDNLILMTGSKIYLNGFTLMAEGQTWISDEIDSVNGVAWDDGRIYGTLGGAVPEPATLLLVGTGALGALGYIRRQRMG